MWSRPSPSPHTKTAPSVNRGRTPPLSNISFRTPSTHASAGPTSGGDAAFRGLYAPVASRDPEALSAGATPFLAANQDTQARQFQQYRHEIDQLMATHSDRSFYAILCCSCLCFFVLIFLSYATYLTTTQMQPALQAALPIINHADALLKEVNRATVRVQPAVDAAAQMINSTTNLMQRMERIAKNPTIKINLGDVGAGG